MGGNHAETDRHAGDGRTCNIRNNMWLNDLVIDWLAVLVCIISMKLLFYILDVFESDYFCEDNKAG